VQREKAVEPIVAWVPSSYGDTATGRFAADAQWIAESHNAWPTLLVVDSDRGGGAMSERLRPGDECQHSTAWAVLYERCTECGRLLSPVDPEVRINNNLEREIERLTTERDEARVALATEQDRGREALRKLGDTCIAVAKDLNEATAALAAKDAALRGLAPRIYPDGPCWCDEGYLEYHSENLDFQHEERCLRARAALALTPAGRAASKEEE